MKRHGGMKNGMQRLYEQVTIACPHTSIPEHGTVASSSSGSGVVSLAKPQLWNVIVDNNVMAKLSARSWLQFSSVHLCGSPCMIL